MFNTLEKLPMLILTPTIFVLKYLTQGLPVSRAVQRRRGKSSTVAQMRHAREMPAWFKSPRSSSSITLRQRRSLLVEGGDLFPSVTLRIINPHYTLCTAVSPTSPYAYYPQHRTSRASQPLLFRAHSTNAIPERHSYIVVAGLQHLSIQPSPKRQYGILAESLRSVGPWAVDKTQASDDCETGEGTVREVGTKEVRGKEGSSGLGDLVRTVVLSRVLCGALREREAVLAGTSRRRIGGVTSR